MKQAISRLKALLEIQAPSSTATVSPENTSQPLFASLDQAMDHFLFQYEKNALPNAPNPLAEKVSHKLTKIIFEADEDMPMDEPEVGGLDLGLGNEDVKNNSDSSSQQTKLPQTPTIDLGKFAGNVARLVNNRETLLDLKNTMLRRINAFFVQNYNQQMAEELMIVLKTNYGLSVDTPSQQIQANQPPAANNAAGDTLGGG